MRKSFLSIFNKRSIVFSLLLFSVVAGSFLSSASPVSAVACDAGIWAANTCGPNQRCVRDQYLAIEEVVGFYIPGTCRTIGLERSVCDTSFVGPGLCFIGKLPFTVIGSVTIGLNALSKAILNGILSFLVTDISYTRSPVVSAGWPIVRDFTNILIVLGFIAIAVATILRWPEGYDAKALLAKLIIAALLVNFSLVICGIMIDIANITIKFFAIGVSRNNLGDALDKISQLWTQLEDPGIPPLRMAMDVISWALVSIISTGARILFIFLFLFRIIAIWMLAILSPLAFVCYVFPATKKVWDTWWSNFSQWVIIGIPGAFFIYLSEQLHNSIITVSPLSSTGSARVLINGFNTIFEALVPAIFLVIGFMFSLQTSAIGASYATTAGRATGKWLGKYAANKGGLTRAREYLKDKGMKMGEVFGVVPKGSRALQQQERLQQDNASKETAALDPKSREGLALGSAYTETAKNRKVEAIRQMAEKGELKNLTAVQRKQAMEFATYHGTSIKDFIKADPALAKYDKNAIKDLKEKDIKDKKPLRTDKEYESLAIQQAVQKAQPHNAKDWSDETLKDTSVQMSLDMSKVKAIIRGGNKKAKDELRKAFTTKSGKKALGDAMDDAGYVVGTRERDMIEKVRQHVKTEKKAGNI